MNKKVAKRWAPGVALACLAAVCWWSSSQADSDNMAAEPIVYEQKNVTPVLSARRMPRSLQAPIAAQALSPEIQNAINLAPPASCVLVKSGSQTLEPSINIDKPLVPASNQKIITTAAGLERLGPNFRFRTTLRSLEAPQNGTIEGDLYLVGEGDPFLTTENWWSQYDNVDGRYHTRLEDLADNLQQLGVTQIQGGIVGDESIYDSVRYGPWAQRLVDSNQSGPLSALTVNEGFTAWPEKFPGSSGDRSPTDNPPLHAATIFTQLLQDRGIAVGAPNTGTTPDNAVVQAAVESPPLSDIVTHINSYSSNIGAELLLKQLGLHASGSGTTAAGVAAAMETLTKTGVSTDQLDIRDGSGLAESNRLTCGVLAQVLGSAGPSSALVESLSVSGQRGSLARVFLDTPASGIVRAKTGTLNDVLSLSGYIGPGDGSEQDLLFVFIANGDGTAANPQTKEARNSLVLSLADYPSAPDLPEFSPSPPA